MSDIIIEFYVFIGMTIAWLAFMWTNHLMIKRCIERVFYKEKRQKQKDEWNKSKQEMDVHFGREEVMQDIRNTIEDILKEKEKK